MKTLEEIAIEIIAKNTHEIEVEAEDIGDSWPVVHMIEMKHAIIEALRAVQSEAWEHEASKPEGQKEVESKARYWRLVAMSALEEMQAMEASEKLVMPSEEEIFGATARAWCHDVNAKKEMDVELAMAVGNEIIQLLRTRLLGKEDAGV